MPTHSTIPVIKLAAWVNLLGTIIWGAKCQVVISYGILIMLDKITFRNEMKCHSLIMLYKITFRNEMIFVCNEMHYVVTKCISLDTKTISLRNAFMYSCVTRDAEIPSNLVSDLRTLKFAFLEIGHIRELLFSRF